VPNCIREAGVGSSNLLTPTNPKKNMAPCQNWGHFLFRVWDVDGTEIKGHKIAWSDFGPRSDPQGGGQDVRHQNFSPRPISSPAFQELNFVSLALLFAGITDCRNLPEFSAALLASRVLRTLILRQRASESGTGSRRPHLQRGRARDGE
jgi:hypothetical protein